MKLRRKGGESEPLDSLSNISKELLKKISEEGFGYMSKTDLETYIFHLYEKYLEFPLSDYELMSLFKISASKLRSLELNRSIKYQQLDLDNEENRQLLIAFFDRAITLNSFEIPEEETGNVKFYVPNAHIYRIIEKYIVDRGSSPNYRLNPKQMEIRYDYLVLLLEKICSEQNVFVEEKGWKKALKESLGKDFKNHNAIKNIPNSIEGMIEAIKDDFKQDGFKYLAEKTITIIVTFLRNQMGLKK